jgi:DNA invertase Pin-like site-specific DNA recombinase
MEKIYHGGNVMGTEYGYVRVSTKEQRCDRQIDALLGVGILQENIYEDKLSGKNFERPQYKRLLRKLKSGDVLFVKSIDRLGRNYAEILEHWHHIKNEKKADIVVLDMPLLDTRSKKNDLTGAFVSDLVLQILSYVAETERVNIRQRQAEGIASAKARGVHFGNPGKPLPDNFVAVVSLWRSKEIRLEDALTQLGIGRTYFYKNIKKLGL